MENLRGLTLAAVICLFAGQIATAQGELQKSLNEQEEDRIGLSHAPVWSSDSSFGPFRPIRIIIENPLNNDRGVVTIKSGDYQVQIPVELPSKTIRTFVAYVSSQGYEDATIDLECDQAKLRVNLEHHGISSESINVGLISDVTSAATFLRSKVVKDVSYNNYGNSQSLSIVDYACLPGLAPDRALGYDGLDLLILGEGAERMTDGEVQAVKSYVLAGGRLLFTGGAISPVIRDPRWAGFLPGSDPRVVSANGSALLSSLMQTRVTDEIALTSLTPSPAAHALTENGVAMTLTKGMGLGEVVFWAFDPFQGALRKSDSRGPLFASLFHGEKYLREQFLLNNGVGLEQAYQYGYGATSPAYGPNDAEPQTSPFQVEIPPTATVFTILALYLIAVVPVNFVLLGRKGKGQWAWVTGPAIGVAFASVFFFISRDLYNKGLSRATAAVIVAHEGVERGYAICEQQYFFPRGGALRPWVQRSGSSRSLAPQRGIQLDGQGRDGLR